MTALAGGGSLMLDWLWHFLRLDGIPDEALPPGSDWRYLTPMERLGVQSQADAEIARELIRRRKEGHREICSLCGEYDDLH